MRSHDATAILLAWLRTWRMPLLLIPVCTGIALLLTAVQRGPGFVPNLIYSFATGGCCCLFIEGGRYACATVLRRRRIARGEPPGDAADMWPGWGWMIPCIALGMPAGVMLGRQIGDVLTGN